MDARIKFIKDPIVICSFIVIGCLGVIIKHEQPKTPQIKEKTVKSDTTESRKQYYEHFYNTK